MRIFQTFLFLFCCALMLGCAKQSVTTDQKSAVLLLDNHGGYSHAGRRITLHSDGSFSETAYTDVVGDEHTKTGHYTLNPERTHLILSQQDGAQQELFRIDYDGQQYWVREADRERITQPSEGWLRETSFRLVP